MHSSRRGMPSSPKRSGSHQSRAWSWFFFFNDTATTKIYTLSLHDALPICPVRLETVDEDLDEGAVGLHLDRVPAPDAGRSEEHTSELQSRRDLVCRLL